MSDNHETDAFMMSKIAIKDTWTVLTQPNALVPGSATITLVIFNALMVAGWMYAMLPESFSRHTLLTITMFCGLTALTISVSIKTQDFLTKLLKSRRK